MSGHNVRQQIRNRLAVTVKPVFKGHLYISEKVSPHDKCPFVTGSLTWGRYDIVLRKRPLITGCPFFGVSLEDGFYCICTLYLGAYISASNSNQIGSISALNIQEKVSLSDKLPSSHFPHVSDVTTFWEFTPWSEVASHWTVPWKQVSLHILKQRIKHVFKLTL